MVNVVNVLKQMKLKHRETKRKAERNDDVKKRYVHEIKTF